MREVDNEWMSDRERVSERTTDRFNNGRRGEGERVRRNGTLHACARASWAERKRPKTGTGSKRDGRSERKGKKIKKEKCAAIVCCVRGVCMCVCVCKNRGPCRWSGGAAAAAAAIPPFPPPNVNPTPPPHGHHILSVRRSPYLFAVRRLLISFGIGEPAGGNRAASLWPGRYPLVGWLALRDRYDYEFGKVFYRCFFTNKKAGNVTIDFPAIMRNTVITVFTAKILSIFGIP